MVSWGLAWWHAQGPFLWAMQAHFSQLVLGQIAECTTLGCIQIQNFDHTNVKVISLTFHVFPIMAQEPVWWSFGVVGFWINNFVDIPLNAPKQLHSLESVGRQGSPCQQCADVQSPEDYPMRVCNQSLIASISRYFKMMLNPLSLVCLTPAHNLQLPMNRYWNVWQSHIKMMLLIQTSLLLEWLRVRL